ncbi:Membrane-fusion protein [Caenispirillum salinarum AK4]|uniref:Membrane-fusion protein n=1 Tax=Caenispirillum salinarum AK4 TaxID=1238182 RepID=K9HHU1_9PROT|nr:efflux RND transporter periplasmic adaptor subunit [Caenispirillum salinarum]EKV28161.1 Membrane-fusion protein [Caenispirillum salinarum AK4]
MKAFLQRHWRKALILPPILVAAGIFVMAVQGREPPVRAETGETATPVRVIAVPRLDVIPRALGYGEVEPGRVWQAVAEVSGRVEWVHPELETGAVLAEGSDLIRFEAADYDLALAQIEAQLAELDARAETTRESLAIEDRNLEVLARDLARKQDLRRTGAASQTTVDTAERALLAGRQQVQGLKNTLALIPSQRNALEAQAETARLDQARTTVRAPFDIRVRAVEVERGQYAQRGQTLATADGIDSADVTAQVPLERLFPLIPEAEAPIGDARNLSGARLPGLLQLTPEVRLTAGERTVTWDGRVTRIAETVDPKTRTIGVIVTVDDPYAGARPGARPPLTRGMFVEVALKGPAREDRLVIPRNALHAGRTVHVADADDRLDIRKVAIAWEQGDIAVIESGLEAGDRVVVTDIVPAVQGMLLAPSPDDGVATRLAAAAGSEGAAR